MSDNYDATLLEQLEDTEGENEILSLEVERLTNQLEAIQAKHDKEQMAVIEQLANLFPTQHGLTPEQYGAWLAKKVRDLRDDHKNGYIDVIINERATQMYHGDKNGMPDPSDRASYDQWMRNGMRTYYDAPMKNVYRTTRDDLVKEFFDLCELLKYFAKQRGANYNAMQNDYVESLYTVAEQRRLKLFKCWLAVQQDTKTYRAPSKPSYDPKTTLMLNCTAAGREDCERALTILKRHAAKRKGKKDYSDLDLEESLDKMYADILQLNILSKKAEEKMMYVSTPKSNRPNKNGVVFRDASDSFENFWKLLDEDKNNGDV